MKIDTAIFILLFVCISLLSCGDVNNKADTVELMGVIQQQGITTYQYGTHTINGVALRSASLALDDFVNETVTVVGSKIEGYPVDGGPDYIEVEAIR